VKILYHITGAITFINEIPWVVEPIYLAQVTIYRPVSLYNYIPSCVYMVATAIICASVIL
jgi:hypothetical protein